MIDVVHLYCFNNMNRSVSNATKLTSERRMLTKLCIAASRNNCVRAGFMKCGHHHHSCPSTSRLSKSNRAHPMPGTADGDAGSRRHVLC